MKMKGRLILVLLAFFVCLFTLSNGISQFNFGTTFNIFSTEYLTNVHIEQSQSATSTVIVTALNGGFDDYVAFDGTTLSINASNALRASGSQISFPWSSWLLLATLISSIFEKRVGIFFCCLLSLSFGYVSLANSNSGTYDVVVQVGSTTIMQSFSIELGEGVVDGGNFNFYNFNVKFDDSSPNNSSIVLDTLGLYSYMNLNCPNNITATDIAMRGTDTSIIVDANDNVFLGFRYYQGAVTLNSQPGALLSLTGNCTWQTNGNVRSGQCSSAPNTLVVTAGGDIIVNFGNPCSANTALQDYVPPSPPLSTTLPSYSISLNNASLWSYRTTWGGSTDGVIFQESSNSFGILLDTNWAGQNLWAACDQCFYYFRPNNVHTVSLSFKTNSTLVSSLAVALMINPAFLGWYQLPDDTFLSQPGQWITLANLTGPTFGNNYNTYTGHFTISSQYAYYSGAFAHDPSVTWNLYQNVNPLYASIILNIALSQSAGFSAPYFSIEDFTITSSPETIVPPANLITNPDELVTIPKMNTTLDPNPRGLACPWNEPNLTLWEDPATWGGSVPSPVMAQIVLPANTKVLVTSCSFNPNDIYNLISIPPTSELIFDDAPITLNVRNIYVQGQLRIGSPTCRLYSNLTITFYGSQTNADMISIGMGSKGIGVANGGFIDIHGKQYHYTWSRLAASIQPGDIQFVLQDAVNWEVGQEIVVTTSIYWDEWINQNEVRTIVAISGRTIEVNQPFNFHHYAGPEYQVEVALLSRRIVLQGDDTSDSQNFGGHVLVSGIGRFSGLQVYRMGQENFLARYPLHFHIADNSGQSFVKDVAVKHCYYRCIVVHGTNNVLVTRNVAFDAIANCYYIEDGVEENSTFSYNLAAFVHVIGTPASGDSQGGVTVQSSYNLTQPADIAAAGFYITNAYNIFIGNAASGGWTGYSFPNLLTPSGLFSSLNFNPSIVNTLIFDGNTAHSTGYFWSSGSGIYVGGQLSTLSGGVLQYFSGRLARSTVDFEGNPAWMQFTNIKTFLCGHGVNHWGDRLELTTYEAHDIQRGATTFGQSWVGGAIIDAQSNNPLTGVSISQGFQFYDTWVETLLTRIEFRNYQSNNSTNPDPSTNNFVIISMTHSDLYKPQGISATRAITHTNVAFSQYLGHYIRDTSSSRYFNFIDYDGTATASSGPTIVGSHEDWWQLSDNCVKEWLVWVCPKTNGTEIAHLYIVIPNLIDNTVQPPLGTSIHVGTIYLWGDGVVGNRSSIVSNTPGITGVTGKGWYLTFPVGSPTTMNIGTYNIPSGTWVMFSISYPAGTTFSIQATYQWGNQGDFTLVQGTSVTDVLNSPNGSKYYFSGGILYIKLVNNVPTPTFTRDGATLYTLQTGYSYVVTATCSGASGGICPPTPVTIPTAIL